MSTLQTAITRGGVAARGIGFAVLSYACFSTGDALIKLASDALLRVPDRVHGGAVRAAAGRWR